MGTVREATVNGRLVRIHEQLPRVTILKTAPAANTNRKD